MVSINKSFKNTSTDKYFYAAHEFSFEKYSIFAKRNHALLLRWLSDMHKELLI